MLSRRDFLNACTRAAIVLFNPWLRPWTSRPAAQQKFPSVSVAEGTNQDTPAQILETALAGLGGIERFVQPGQTVAIKPNATWAYPPGTASSTHPDFLTAVIQTVQKAGAGRIIVMDHCSIEPGASSAVSKSGIGRVVKTMGVEGIFLDRFNAPRSAYTKIDLPNGKANQSLGVIKEAVEADVRINLAVAKSHNVTRLTMCLKHMMGFLQQPGLLHSSLEQGIADLSTPSAVQAQLHLLEAIRVRMPYGNYQVCAGPETDETHPHIVARRNIVIAGTDPVLIDAYGCINLFDIQPQELTHLLLANESGCGDMDVETALTDGRIRRFKVGVPIPEDPTPAAATANAPQQSPALKPAESYPPTPAPQAQSLTASSSGEAVCVPSNQVIGLSPLMNTVLIPAAAVVAGIGLAILNRMRRRLPKSSRASPEETPNDEGRK